MAVALKIISTLEAKAVATEADAASAGVKIETVDIDATRIEGEAPGLHLAKRAIALRAAIDVFKEEFGVMK